MARQECRRDWVMWVGWVRYVCWVIAIMCVC
jgi:hypothetical protein